MEIKLRVSDLIERMLWDNYKKFCLYDKEKEEIEKIIGDNEEFIINEKDAFVIGLLNVIYTEEVIYKYKQFLREIIENKSFRWEYTEGKERLYITRRILLNNAIRFKNKIPKGYKSDRITFNKQTAMLKAAHKFFIDEIKKLEHTIIQDWPCVKHGQVKKIINRIDSYDFE